MEVLYHIRPYFVGISPYIGLKNRPQICQVPPIQDPQMAIEFIFFFLVDIGTRKCCGLAPFPWSSWATLTQCCISSGYPLVMTNTSPWLSHGPNRNRWFTELKNGWIFPWQTVNVITRVQTLNKSRRPPTIPTSRRDAACPACPMGIRGKVARKGQPGSWFS